MKYFSVFLRMPLLLLLLLSCRDQAPAPAVALAVDIRHEVEGQPLVPDALIYTTPKGYPYSVSRLEYYLSDIRLEKTSGEVVPVINTFYVNAWDASTTRLLLPGIPPGAYRTLHFVLGLPAAKNKTGALPNTLANANMAWPEPMGGGYHFIKLEGRYTTTTAEEKGYALHLGTNINQVHVHINQPFAITEVPPALALVMNLNEWLRNPHPIDFEVDGTNSMFTPTYMQRLAANGATVFQLTPLTR